MALSLRFLFSSFLILLTLACISIGAKKLGVSCTYFRRFYKEKPKGCLFVLTLLRNEFYDVRNKFQTMMHLEQQIEAYSPK
uniref:Histidine-containing phosphotransfer protein n=1 Tax=Aegilops tauschii TaxID=37682 RepID=N1R0G2_AEGTA